MVEETVTQRLSTLEKRHKDLKSEVLKLERRTYLTPQEQRQVADLKKMKLSAKDQIHALRRQILALPATRHAADPFVRSETPLP